VEIDEVAARLVRRYWALLVICTFLPVLVVALSVMGQPATYAADARIITSSEVPVTASAADAIVSQVQGIATGPTSAGKALRNAGVETNLADFLANHVTVSGLGTSQVVDVIVTDPSPQVAQKAARVLADEVVNALNKVSQGGLSSTLDALDSEIVSLTEQRAALAAQIAQDPQNQALQTKLAGLDEVIANFTSDRGRLLIQASTQGLAYVIDQPGLPQVPESKALAQKLGLAGLLGLVLGILLAAIAETIRPTVPGARKVSRRLSSPMLGSLTAIEMRGTRTFNFDNVALQVRLAAANAGVSTVALVDVERQWDVGDLAGKLTHAMPLVPAATVSGASNGADNGAKPGATITDSGSRAVVIDRAPHAVTDGCSVRVCSIEQLQRQTEIQRAGIVVLSGPVARVSRISALSDLSVASGWPIIGVVGIPRARKRQSTRRDPEAAGPQGADRTITAGVAPAAQTTGKG
jgi:capsular polysaccharide biosynthesis protein